MTRKTVQNNILLIIAVPRPRRLWVRTPVQEYIACIKQNDNNKKVQTNRQRILTGMMKWNGKVMICIADCAILSSVL